MIVIKEECYGTCIFIEGLVLMLLDGDIYDIYKYVYGLCIDIYISRLGVNTFIGV